MQIEIICKEDKDTIERYEKKGRFYKVDQVYVTVNQEDKIKVLNRVPYLAVDSVEECNEVFFTIYFKKGVTVEAGCIKCGNMRTANHGACDCSEWLLDAGTIQVTNLNTPRVVLYNGPAFTEEEINPLCLYFRYNFLCNPLEKFIEILKKEKPDELILREPICFTK